MAKKKKNTLKVISKTKPKPIGRWHPTPLKSSFMLLAMIGFLASYYIVYSRSPSFGIAFMIVFIAMFISSLISLTKAPIIDEKT